MTFKKQINYVHMKQLEKLSLNDVTIMSENEMKSVSGGLGGPENRRDDGDAIRFSCTCSKGGGFMGGGL
jgi:natural product precursor